MHSWLHSKDAKKKLGLNSRGEKGWEGIQSSVKKETVNNFTMPNSSLQ